MSEWSKSQFRFMLPYGLEHLCPLWVSIIGIGAMAAAVMSSADSTILRYYHKSRNTRAHTNKRAHTHTNTQWGILAIDIRASLS